jgi:hypothetical protein
MRRILTAAGLFLLSNYGCKKKCELASQYVVPMYLKISPVPRVKLGNDTVTVTATVPYNTADLRLPGYPVSLKEYKPSNLYFGVSPCLPNDSQPIPPVDPFKSGLMELIIVSGKKVSPNLLFDFSAGDTAWVVSFKLVPKKGFDGIFFLSASRIQYKDACVQIDPVTVLVNTPKSHHLIRERLNWPLSPWENDVFFYVE